MIVLEWLFLTIAPCDAAEPWQLGSQDAATPMIQGIIDLHHDIFFFLILILVFVSRILVRALWRFPPVVINHMENDSTSRSASSSSSSSSNKEKRKEKENLLRNLVVKEVDDYLNRHKQEIIAEFPRSHPYFETAAFLNRVTTELIQGAGLLPTDTAPKMNFLRSVHQNLIDDFNLVRTEGYKNNAIYACIRSLLKDYR